MTDQNRILLVEDNQKFGKAGFEYLNQKTENEIILAGNYIAGEAALNLFPFDGVITDCFFPYTLGKDNLEKGQEAIDKMIAVNPRRDTLLIRSIKQVKDLGVDAVEVLLKNAGKTLKDADNYWVIEQRMKQNPANQPLGILVAEMAEERGIPFVLATSTYHHDVMTQPIQDYCGRKGWTLIDCADGREADKSTPEFWKKAYSALERKMQEVGK